MFSVGFHSEAFDDTFPCTYQAQNRTTYYAPNQLAQMRPNPRWQQQGGRGQGGCEACSDLNRSFLFFQ